MNTNLFVKLDVGSEEAPHHVSVVHDSLMLEVVDLSQYCIRDGV